MNFIELRLDTLNQNKSLANKGVTRKIGLVFCTLVDSGPQIGSVTSFVVGQETAPVLVSLLTADQSSDPIAAPPFFVAAITFEPMLLSLSIFLSKLSRSSF
jgi:hypothetical protein